MNRNQSIGLFDGSTVALAAIGLVLIAVEVFVALPQGTQSVIASSASMLDMHEHWVREIDLAASALDTAKEFENQFYLAFVDVASIPTETMQLPPALSSAYDGFLAYVDGLTIGNQENLAYQVKDQGTGKVLGTVIENLILR